MKYSNRIAQVETHYFAKKLAEIRALNLQGKDIINLGIGSPNIDPPESVIKVLQETALNKGASQYQSYNGIEELRKAIAKWYHTTYGVSLCAEKEILPLMGSKEAIMHIHLAFCNPGDTVLIPNPGYLSYASSAKLLGLNIKYYNLHESNNWIPSIDKLEEMSLNDCKVMWINYPNMPTGAKLQKDDYERLITFAKKHELLLVNDNPYSLIVNEKPTSIHSFSNGYKDVLELNSLSKSHNMSGWRVGMVTGNEQNIKPILKVKNYFDSGMYKPIQLAAAKALSLGNEWFDKLNLEYKERANIVYEILDALNCSYNTDNQGLFVWARVNSRYQSGEKLSDDLLYNYNIFATPGFVFGTNGEDYIRFSLCADQNELKEALNRIKTRTQ